MGMTGEIEGRPPARPGADQAPALRLAARQRRRADPGGGRLALRRQRPPLPRGGRHERRHPAGGGAHGPVRGGHRVHPRAGRLRADGQGPRVDGARRPAPRARRGRRGRHPGGARRLARALPQVGRRRPRGGRRRGVHRAHQAVPVLHALPQPRGAAAARDGRPGRAHGRRAARRAPGVQPQALRHVRRHPPHRRRRRMARPQAAVGQDDHHLLRALRRAPGRHRGQPAAPARRHPRQRLGRQGGALRQPLQRLRPAARLPAGRAGLHGRHQGRGGGDHPPRGQDAARGGQRDGARRSPSCCARPTARATTS